VISALAARLPKGSLTWPGPTIANRGKDPLHNVAVDWLPTLDTTRRHRPGWVVFVGGPPRFARLAPGEAASFGISPAWVNPSGWTVRTRWTGVEGADTYQTWLFRLTIGPPEHVTPTNRGSRRCPRLWFGG
jgi:hypothetical protein